MLVIREHDAVAVNDGGNAVVMARGRAPGMSLVAGAPAWRDDVAIALASNESAAFTRLLAPEWNDGVVRAGIDEPADAGHKRRLGAA